MHRSRLRSLPLLASLLSLVLASNAQAGVLASELLITPLAPGMPSSKQLYLPEGHDPKQPTWVSYQVFAMSPSEDPEGEIVVTGMFEREPTGPSASTVLFEPRDLQITESAGTIDAQFKAMAGERSDDEMREIFGPELHGAYKAVNAGTGRLLSGTAVRILPPLSQGDPIVLVSVDRASGIQPVGLMVTVGQGEVPAELQPNVESTGAFKFGFGLGRMLMLGLLAAGLYWFFIGRKREG